MPLQHFLHATNMEFMDHSVCTKSTMHSKYEVSSIEVWDMGVTWELKQISLFSQHDILTILIELQQQQYDQCWQQLFTLG